MPLLAPDPAAHAGASAAADPGEVALAGSQSKAKLALTVEKVKSARFDREVKQKLYHRVDECELRQARQVAAVRDELINLVAACPFAQEVKDWLEARLRDACEKFARGET